MNSPKALPLPWQLALLLLAFLFVTGPLSAQPSQPAAATAGAPWAGGAGITETMRQINIRDESKNWVGHSKPALVPRPIATGHGAATERHPATSRGGSLSLRAPQTVSFNFTAATTTDCSGFP